MSFWQYVLAYTLIGFFVYGYLLHALRAVPDGERHKQAGSSAFLWPFWLCTFFGMWASRMVHLGGGQ